MSEINVQLKDGAPVAVPSPTTVAEALKKLDRDLAKQALAARVNGQEVDLAYTIEPPANGDAVKIEPSCRKRWPVSMCCAIPPRTCWPRRCWIFFRERSWVLARRCWKIRATG